VVRVIIQEVHQVFRAGIVLHLNTDADIEVVGAVSEATDVLELYDERPAAIVVLDAGLATELVVRRIRRAHSNARLIGLTASGRGEPSPAATAGFDALVDRRDGLSALITEIRAQAADGPPPARRRAAHQVRPRRTERPVPVVLTPRELTILDLISGGSTTAEMAALLQISCKTVENHKQRVFAKLGVQNQAHAVSLAVRAGLLSPLARPSAV
jgi:DNA-binding NarL/FixJ family response regulator